MSVGSLCVGFLGAHLVHCLLALAVCRLVIAIAISMTAFFLLEIRVMTPPSTELCASPPRKYAGAMPG